MSLKMKNSPKRKSPRLKEYDYSASGAYFVTVCTHGKEYLLSRIVGAIHESPENTLTAYGIIVDEVINKLSDRFNVTVDKYVVMPNHIHILLSIPGNTLERAIRESPLQYKQASISRMVGWLKMNASKKIHTMDPNLNVWQRSFHDHIIRNETDYQKIWEYIDTNILKWEMDCFYTE